MSLYAVETETQTHTTTKHFIPYGKQLEGRQGRWTVSCGRYVRGEVWDAGSVDGVICKQCLAEEVKQQQWREKRGQK